MQNIKSWIADEGYAMEGLSLGKLAAKDEAPAVTDRDALELTVAAWNQAARTAVDNGEFPKPDLKAPRSRVPNAIYNGMIAPLVPFSIKGVVWYQGESNRGGQDYYEKLKALTGGWSKVFDVPDMPFYLVQLAPYDYAHNKRVKTVLSEQLIYDSVVSAQYKAADEIKGCDVITIPDTVFGQVANIHPPHIRRPLATGWRRWRCIMTTESQWSAQGHVLQQQAPTAVS